MDFDFSDEQRMLQDSVDRLMADNYGFQERVKILKSPEGFSRSVWAKYAELGILGLPFAEADGGLGGSSVETMLVMESLGKKLAMEPYLATVVLAGGALRHAGSDAQRADLVPQITDGSLIMALAHSERQARYNLASVKTTARKDGDGYVLNGEKTLVLGGDAADKLVVSARVSGGESDEAGVGLFLVDAKAAGVARRGYPLQDGRRAAEITLENVKVAAGDVLTADKGVAVVTRVIDEAIAAICAEGVGAMETLTNLTVEYLKTRKQFGVAIGHFQVLQHRAVDMLIATDEARSMAMFASMMAQEPNAAERRPSISAAKVQLCKSARTVGQEGTQLHGGIGMTMEYEGGHYFKRLTVLSMLFGDHDHHLRVVAKSGGLEKAA